MPNVQHAHHRDATPNRASRPRRCSAPRNRIINRKIILKYPCQEHPPKTAMPKNSMSLCPAQPNGVPPCPTAKIPCQGRPALPSPAQGCAALPVSVLPCPQRNLHNKEICPILMSTLPCLAQPSPKIRYPTQGEICIIEKICPILTFPLPQAKGPLPALPSHT